MAKHAVTLVVNADTWRPEDITSSSIQMILNSGLSYEVLDGLTGEVLGTFEPDPSTYKGFKFVPAYEELMLKAAVSYKQFLDSERELHEALFNRDNPEGETQC